MAAPTTQELFNLTDKVALITGGARNLGFDMATAMAEVGAEIAITSRHLENAQASAQTITDDTGKRVVGFACDVADESQVERLIDDVIAEFAGTTRLVSLASKQLQMILVRREPQRILRYMTKKNLMLLEHG